MQELCEALLDLFGFGFGSDKPEEVIIGLCRLPGYAAWSAGCLVILAERGCARGIIRSVVGRSEVVEEGQHGVGGSVASGRCGGPGEAVESLLFEGEIGVQVDHRGVGLLVAEPERDHGGVHAGVQQGHRAAVAQGVRGDVPAGQGRAGGGVFGHESLKGVAGERLMAAGGEQDVVGLIGEFVQPRVQHCDGGAGQRGDAVLAPFAVAAHVCAGPEVQVLDAQPAQLTDPEAGLDGQGEQGVVAAAEPVGFQNPATGSDQRFQAAASYLLIKLPRIGRRRLLPRNGLGTGACGRGGRS